MLTLPGAVLKSWMDAKDKDGKGGILILCHGAVATSDVVELSASLRFAAVTNSHRSGTGGECLGVVEDTSLMEVTCCYEIRNIP